MISHSIIHFLILYIYIFLECHYFALNFILILYHLQVTCYEDRIILLYDYIILDYKHYNIIFTNDYIMLELVCNKKSLFIRVSVITNAN